MNKGLITSITAIENTYTYVVHVDFLIRMKCTLHLEWGPIP